MMISLTKAKAKTNRAVEAENQDVNNLVKISNLRLKLSLFPEAGMKLSSIK